MKKLVLTEVMAQSKKILDEVDNFSLDEKETILAIVELNYLQDVDGLVKKMSAIDKEKAKEYLDMAAIVLERVNKDSMLYVAEHGDATDVDKLTQYIEKKDEFIAKALDDAKVQQPAAK